MKTNTIEAVNTKKRYKPISPDSGDWPVMALSRNRKKFIEEVVEDGITRIRKQKTRKSQLIEELELTLYKERMRIAQNHWKIDPDDESAFWENIKSKLVAISSPANDHNITEEDILSQIVERYADEIAGKFKRTSYRLARSLITFWFARLLNASRIKRFGSFWSTELTLQDKIHITGHVDQLRELAKKGTVVMTPTHFSNLDPVLMGWVIHTLGLPPFVYAADLNLFNIELFAYFMNSLGAFKVDRRKENPIYQETLRSYSINALLKGCHTMFFPGGTRSRSGKIEKRLKLSLLGTAIEAQRILFEKEKGESATKIFIVPVAINYNFVLEAPSLINEYLKQKGQERYYTENDEYASSYKIIKFLFKFFTKGSDISLSIGRPIDLFGHYVDENGVSYDRHGRSINTRDYFVTNGKIKQDPQRDLEYTQMLSGRLVEEFHKINRVFASHLCAFTAFKILQKQHSKLDLFNLLRLQAEEQTIAYNDFKRVFIRLREQVFKLHEDGKTGIAPHLYGNPDKVIEFGVSNIGIYHSKRPLIKTRDGNIITQDLNTLFYYHNRMDGYGLEKYV